VLVAGFAAAVAIGAGAVAATDRPRAEDEGGVALQAMQPTLKGGINAALAVTEKKWGTRLDWTCEYVKDRARAAPAYDIVVPRSKAPSRRAGHGVQQATVRAASRRRR
jgi:hypothetical protein